MALEFKIYQSKVNNKTKDKFYARALHHDTVGVKELARTMQANCTVKYSDIVAVLAELSEVLKQELQRGNRVKRDGLGTFKITLRTTGSDTAKEFSVAQNITGSRVAFIPETSVDAGGNHVKSLLSGLKVREASSYESLKEKETEEDAGE